MARPPNHLRDDAVETMRKLTAQHGVREGIRLARERFPGVPPGTWGRWRQQAIGGVASAEGQVLGSLADEIRHSIPTPEQLAASIPAARKALDFWRMLDELESDARLLRDFALGRGADGELKVRVPFALRDAHRMRCELIRIALQHAEAAWSAERARSFFDAVLEEVGAVSPDCQRRIMERLQVLNGEAASRGF